MRHFIGHGSEKERWAFAFSAKEDWRAKVRSDVAGIVGTGRGYDRIIFVTNQFAKDKQRADMEDELSKASNLPVTIHDRTWIIQQVIEADRKHLAFNYLGVGRETNDPFSLGPGDYSRSRQLASIEAALSDPMSYEGMRRQEVAEGLLAAKLSRSLEKPRFETDGRFSRAIRLAEKYGSERQQFEARYEALWTAICWFDDLDLLHQEYDAFEGRVIGNDHIPNLEFVSNLLQMLVNSVLHGTWTAEECRLAERVERLNCRLDVLALDENRPNNALEAKTLRLMGSVNQALLTKDQSAVTAIWPEFSEVIAKAEGLGEFDAVRLEHLLEAFAPLAGNDLAFTRLVEEFADFITTRKGEAEGARVLVRRVAAMDLDQHFEMIRLLGKAARRLIKKEYADDLIEALQHLSIAYRHGGLLWASRATTIFAMASIAIEGEKESTVDPAIVPMAAQLAWITLQLRHIPDFLHCIQFLNGCLASLPLDEKSKSKLQAQLQTLDSALASNLLNSSTAELNLLSELPDIFPAMGMTSSFIATMYTLGYEDRLKADGWLPEGEDSKEISQFLSILASQPVSDDIRGPLLLNSGERGRLEAFVMGVTVEVIYGMTDTAVLLAEAIVASIEACFATAFELDVHPHTERFTISIVEDADALKPSLDLNAERFSGTVIWPVGRSPGAHGRGGQTNSLLIEVAVLTMAATCMSKDMSGTIEKLLESEALGDRVAMISVLGNSYNRFFSRPVSRLADWADLIKDTYPVRDDRPRVTKIVLPPGKEEADDLEPQFAETANRPVLNNHRDVSVASVIDVHLWDRAKWGGTVYARLDPMMPPVMALMFKDDGAARGIFERWRERFGAVDREDEIHISIIKNVSVEHPLHYTILVTSSRDRALAKKPGGTMIMARFHRMKATTDVNLRRFIADFEHMGVYLLAPAVMDHGEPRVIKELAILKRNITVKPADQVGPADVERMAMSKTADAYFSMPDED